MLMMKKCGGTPCDRRSDRRKVAIAAAAVLLVFATSARADEVWQISPSQSSLTVMDYLNAVSPGYDSPQNVSGNVDQYFGLIHTQTTGTSSIQLLADNNSFMSAAVNPVGPFVPGLYNNGQVGDGLAPPYFGNWGTALTAVGAVADFREITAGVLPYQTSGALAGFGNFTMPLIPNGSVFNFPVGAINSTHVGQALLIMSGHEDIFSSLGSGTSGLANNPISLNTPLMTSSQFNSAPTPVKNTYFAHTQGGVGTWDPVAQTLSIPVDSLALVSLAGLPVYVQIYGTLVATPVPEPSTVTLFGCGIVGLLSYAWRARRRRALIA